MLPREVTVKLVEEELPGLKAWSERKGIDLTWHPELLILRAALLHKDEKFYLQGEVDAYRAMPPGWTFRASDWTGGKTPSDWPASGNIPGGGGSIFHNNILICAHFNRYAYAEHQGPHNDWNGTANWLRAGSGTVQAHTLADMIAAITLHLRYSNGRMG